MQKSLFGKFNPVIDEAGHAILTILITLVSYFSGLSLEHTAIAFILGFAIDIDHFFNTFICKRILKVKNYKGTHFRCDQGYTPKILHGIDIALVVGILLTIYTDTLFGLTVFLVLSFHEIWDFIVYSHKANELLFITRMYHRFKPGKRNYLRGLIFDEDTLMW